MKFISNFHKTALSISIEKGNSEIVEYLLGKQDIDINIKSIEIKTLIL